MSPLLRPCLTLFAVLLMAAVLPAETKTVIEHNNNEAATAAFKFPTVPSPSPTDAAGSARFSVVAGRLDSNSGGTGVLGDGKLPASDDEPSANCFSEIDVDDGTPHEVPNPVTPEPRVEIVTTEGGDYQISIDTTQTPDLTTWVHDQLAPVVREWYPKIIALLASDGYEAPRKFVIRFDAEMRGVAATSGTDVHCAADWMRQNLAGEAKGAIVHELVHVVQQYNRGGRRNRRTAQTPGWLVEGIADYVRWFLYEPESRGAEISGRNVSRARYDASYRVSANFINWVTQKYDPQVVTKLNAAAREGRYQDDLWKEYTGRTLQELGDEWKASLAK